LRVLVRINGKESGDHLKALSPGSQLAVVSELYLKRQASKIFDETLMQVADLLGEPLRGPECLSLLGELDKPVDKGEDCPAALMPVSATAGRSFYLLESLTFACSSWTETSDTFSRVPIMMSECPHQVCLSSRQVPTLDTDNLNLPCKIRQQHDYSTVSRLHVQSSDSEMKRRYFG
jgi:hypothetical protein